MVHERKKAGVLGATGSVGQRFMQLLANHPDFELAALGASSRSAGKKYSVAAEWKQSSPLPQNVASIVVQECKPENFSQCDVVFSGLDSDVAGDVEKAFVDAGLAVISNAKNYRRANNVPLVVPTANPEHLDICAELKKQKKGIHICISNCSTAGMVVPMKALIEKFGPISQMIVTTMQAISGAGFSPGVSSMDILDNLIPYISGEEDKLEYEPRKILAPVSADGISFDIIPEEDFKISASCNRVAVIDGHTECLSIKFKNSPAPSPEEVKQALREYKSPIQEVGCYSAPEQLIHVFEEPNRPQPRLDRDLGRGYACSVGRVREDPVFDVKFVVLSHNTILGAAGSGVLIAEYLLAKKYI